MATAWRGKETPERCVVSFRLSFWPSKRGSISIVGLVHPSHGFCAGYSMKEAAAK